MNKISRYAELSKKYDYLFAKEQPFAYSTECFQKVLINLEYVNLDGHQKVIQFTSTLANEGKSTLISNMAYLLGQKGKKVVVIDLDLRIPKLHRVFNATNRLGLTDYLAGKIEFDRLIRHSEKIGIDYIVSGEKTSAVINILESKKLSALIDQLKESYDYILLDTPPVLAVSDALFIAKITDGIIFVVAQGQTKKALVREAISTLKNKHVNIIGFILNKVKLNNSGYGYGYDYKYEE